MLRNDHIKKYLCDNKDIEKDVVESMIRKSDSLFEEKGIGLGSIYDGDTLRVVRGNEEKKIRFCGTDAPEIKQKLGVESRDYLRSLIPAFLTKIAIAINLTLTRYRFETPVDSVT